MAAEPDRIPDDASKKYDCPLCGRAQVVVWHPMSGSYLCHAINGGKGCSWSCKHPPGSVQDGMPSYIPADDLAKLEEAVLCLKRKGVRYHCTDVDAQEAASLILNRTPTLIAAAKDKTDWESAIEETNAIHVRLHEALHAELAEAVKLLEPLVAEDIGPYAKYHGAILSAEQYRAAAAIVAKHRGTP